MRLKIDLPCTAAALVLALTSTAVTAQTTSSPQQRPTVLVPTGTPTALVATSKSDKASDAIRVLLIPDRETTLSSPVAAKLKQISMSMGASFGTGQTLVELDCDEPLARLAMAKAELSGAIETHEAKVRMQGLEQASDVEVALAASAVEKDRAQVQLYRSQIKQCAIVAPWAGRISKVYVRSHMTVAPGQPLFDLVKNGPLRLRFNLPSKGLSQIKTGQDFDVNIEETGKIYQAKVKAINSRVDPVSQTIEVEGALAKSYPELLSGMTGTVKLPLTNSTQ